MVMKILPMVEPDEAGALAVLATRGGAAKLFYTLITMAKLTRQQTGELLGRTGASATSYVHGLRPLPVGILARTAEATGHRLVLQARSRSGGDAMELPTDWLSELTFDELDLTAGKLAFDVLVLAVPVAQPEQGDSPEALVG
jgi:hypothetical protein